ncbi:MAG: hypothetical protein WCW16_05445 [Candidatus Magasanikbacteria bacterium]
MKRFVKLALLFLVLFAISACDINSEYNPYRNTDTSEGQMSEDVRSCPEPEVPVPEENCMNGKDDNKDGAIDCDDPECWWVPFCECRTDFDCEDDLYCTENSCVRGACVVKRVEGCCDSDAECDDGNPCTTEDRCEWHKCWNAVPRADDHIECTDNDRCTVGDHCNLATCVPGEELVCDDGNPCTLDMCDPERGCVFDREALEGQACELPDPCYTNTVCQSGNCWGEDVINACWDEGGGEVCDDGVNNDSDELTDCGDPECFIHVACAPNDPILAHDSIENALWLQPENEVYSITLEGVAVYDGPYGNDGDIYIGIPVCNNLEVYAELTYECPSNGCDDHGDVDFWLALETPPNGAYHYLSSAYRGISGNDHTSWLSTREGWVFLVIHMYSRDEWAPFTVTIETQGYCRAPEVCTEEWGTTFASEDSDHDRLPPRDDPDCWYPQWFEDCTNGVSDDTDEFVDCDDTANCWGPCNFPDLPFEPTYY